MAACPGRPDPLGAGADDSATWGYARIMTTPGWPALTPLVRERRFGVIARPRLAEHPAFAAACHHATGGNPFGPNAPLHLARTDSFPNAPDILVMSMFDPATGDVAAFEELVGCHGGLGGPQTKPFVLFPTELVVDPERPIVGAADLHHVLKSWTPAATHPAATPITV